MRVAPAVLPKTAMDVVSMATVPAADAAGVSVDPMRAVQVMTKLCIDFFIEVPLFFGSFGQCRL